MSGTSSIEWTDATWNPVVGCREVSPGCDHCYAAREAAGRLSTTAQYRGLAVRLDGRAVFTGEARLLRDRLDQPLHWTRARRVFVNSMSDLFHVDVPLDFLAEVFARMMVSPRHTFQVLTKRAARMEQMLTRHDLRGLTLFAADQIRDTLVPDYPWPLPNVWLGVSVESDDYYSRIRHLQRTPAAVRFLSCEPLLGPLDDLPLVGIDWVIVGGESGPGARPMHPAWVRGVRDQCRAAGVPFFFKQWGEWAPAFDEPEMERFTRRVGKKAAGRTIDGRTWDEMPLATIGGTK